LDQIGSAPENDHGQLSTDAIQNQIDSDAIERLLNDAARKFLQAYQTDIPLYSLLYKELDQLRSDERYPLEVYLGRDGIYAYIGRQAQAKTRLLGAPVLEQRQMLQSHELLIKPTYLIYPRVFA